MDSQYIKGCHVHISFGILFVDRGVRELPLSGGHGQDPLIKKEPEGLIGSNLLLVREWF